MRVTVASLEARYDDVISTRLADPTTQSRCRAAVEAANSASSEVYDQVWRLAMVVADEQAGLRSFCDAMLSLGKLVCGVAQQRSGDVVSLYADAAAVHADFATSVQKAELGRLGATVCVSALKRTTRIIEKVALRPTQPGWAGEVCDVVRAMVIASSMEQVAQAVQAFTKLAVDGVIIICRVKDRFAAPTVGGWRDAMINFRMAADETQHVCEVQIAHSLMLMARTGLSGHQLYALTRNAIELLESGGYGCA